MNPRLLPLSFYRRDTATVARELLGQNLCHRLEDGTVLKGRIVETEAYLGIEDPACHTYGDRRTPRTQSMYLDGGHSYVYLIYGIHHCLNVVTRTSRHPEAVLLRALAPLSREEGATTHKLANGPGKLCRYLGLDRRHDGLELWKRTSGLWIEAGTPVPPNEILPRPRIGVEYAGPAAKWPLRFLIKGDPAVSKK